MTERITDLVAGLAVLIVLLAAPRAEATLRFGPLQIAGLRMLDHNRVYLFENLFRGDARITIGKSRQRDIYLQDPSVNSKHALIGRLPGGKYTIYDWGGGDEPGIYVSPVGLYSKYEKVERYTLHFGAHLRLGDVVLTPVNAQGEAPFMVWDLKDFARNSKLLYGSFREAARHVGLNRESLRIRAKRRRRRARSSPQH